MAKSKNHSSISTTILTAPSSCKAVKIVGLEDILEGLKVCVIMWPDIDSARIDILQRLTRAGVIGIVDGADI